MVAVAGAIVATLCDANHVYTGTLSYPRPVIFGQPLWVFPGFFMVFIGMGILYWFLPNMLGGKIACEESTTGNNRAAFMETLLFFAFVYLLSGFGNRSPALLSVLFYGSFLLRLACTYDRVFLFVLAVLLCVGGMFGEGVMTQLDLVHYRAPEIFGVPWWRGGL